jgi:Ca2+-binding RTX toxin-like protein
MLRSLARVFGPRTTTDRRGRRTKKARLPLAIEALEGRCVLSTLQVVDDLLTYTAGAAVANNLSVSLSGGVYTFRDTAETISVLGIPGATGSGTNTVTVPATGDGLIGISINLGDRNDVLSIDSAVHTIAVKGGDGHDTIDVGTFVGGNLSAIKAAVTVDGEAGTDTVRVNDTGSSFARGYTVTAAKVTVTKQIIQGGSNDEFDVSYTGTENLAVNAGSASGGIYADLFSVRGTKAGTKTTLNGGEGDDSFTVGNTANTLDDIQGVLVLNGGNDQFGDGVFFLDHGSSARSYTLRADQILARTGSAQIAYSGLEGLSLNTGDFADSVAVIATTADTPVFLNLGGGNDRVTLGTAAISLDGFGSAVSVNGQAGTDAIILNDQGDTNANVYVVNTTEVRRNGSAILSYAGAESLTLNAGSFDDEAYVQSTLATTPVALKMGDGDDVVGVGSGSTLATTSLAAILGALTVDGQAGSDSLTLYDLGSTPLIFNEAGTALIPVDYTVTANSVSRTQVAPITYASLDVLSVFAATAPLIFFTPFTADGNDIVVKGTSAGTLFHLGTYGSYTVTVGSDGQSLDTIQGAFQIISQGSLAALVLNDQGDANANSYAITNASVARSGAAMIYYALVNPSHPSTRVTLNAGASGDTVAVTSTSALVPVTLNMGAGSDTVTVGGGPLRLDGIASTVSVNGQAGADAITLSDVDPGMAPVPGNGYLITSTSVTRGSSQVLAYDTAESLTLNAGTGDDIIAVASARPETPVVVRAGLGNDTLRLGSFGVPVLDGAVTLDGQGGTDWLDYSTSPMGVRANLALGTATGAAGGVSNIENVTGGQGDDILVGNDQANVLWGRHGRDILIGRGGADQLLGETGDDLLIGGSTAHDLAPARLEDLMTEWGRTDLQGTLPERYLTRVNHLLGVTPGGLNGMTTLTLSQVSDDGVADSLEGGSALDWFFALGADIILDLEPNERVN